MSDSKSRPVLCTECSQPMESPICCAGCGALNPLPPSLFTYFELFGLEPTYEIDLGELRRKYLTLSRSIHPDVAGRTSDSQRAQSLALSSGLNRAYETLRNPVDRAEYLLHLANGPSAADDKSVPGELLGEVMMLREQIEEATEASDQDLLASTRAEVLKQQKETLEEIASICRSGDLKEPATQQRLRQQLNAVKYWNNLLEKIPLQVES
ncbi:MAG TPA: Fe-S protein assembly co-chaperone HscB [Phycisphaerae bacterium]|nr:Fe-S protein assembly co-chaperone HscB [Phycisphaerae bacterium]HQE28133.1 Fe-S protein assembly co-chaperone HscB [Phycisphaerae bacterium]